MISRALLQRRSFHACKPLGQESKACLHNDAVVMSNVMVIFSLNKILRLPYNVLVALISRWNRLLNDIITMMW